MKLKSFCKSSLFTVNKSIYAAPFYQVKIESDVSSNICPLNLTNHHEAVNLLKGIGGVGSTW